MEEAPRYKTIAELIEDLTTPRGTYVPLTPGIKPWAIKLYPEGEYTVKIVSAAMDHTKVRMIPYYRLKSDTLGFPMIMLTRYIISNEQYRENPHLRMLWMKTGGGEFEPIPEDGSWIIGAQLKVRVKYQEYDGRKYTSTLIRKYEGHDNGN